MYFFTDLDNTLVFSHRCLTNKERRWIETLHGKPQGYMTCETYEYLKHATWLSMIPITTRTQRQYKRLSCLQEDLRCAHALVDNGAILLVDGQVEERWLEETKQLVEEEYKEVQRLSRILEAQLSTQSLHEEPFFTYVVCGEDPTLYDILTQHANQTLVTIRLDRGKLYCLPKKLTKGMAMQRYLARFKQATTVVAGDSEFDCSMLELADYALLPEQLEQRIQHPQKFVMKEDPILSDEICKTLDLLHKKGCFDD